MKKIISIVIFSAFCFSAGAQDKMDKKMENKTDDMNKKPVSPNDPMNKKPVSPNDPMNKNPENHGDSLMIKKVPLNSDTMQRQSVPKSPEKKPAVL